MRPDWYDRKTMNVMKTSMPMLNSAISLRPIPKAYKSIWRVLHIDGFEGERRIYWNPRSTEVSYADI